MSAAIPSAEQQLCFLQSFQRILDEGEYTSTYKFALLLALADIAVEQADDSGGKIEIPLITIAEKFIHYYWRQVAPFPALNSDNAVLLQNTGRQIALGNRILRAREKYAGSLVKAKSDKKGWGNLTRDAARLICNMPLWRLQRVGNGIHDFLYSNQPIGTSVDLICLKPISTLSDDTKQLAADLVRGTEAQRGGTHGLPAAN